MTHMTQVLTRYRDPSVAAAFGAFPVDILTGLQQLRELIFQVASETSGIVQLQETLKWGQPSYMPATARIGTTIRLGAPKNTPGKFAMFFHCQTTLVEDFRELYPDVFKFQGNRALVFSPGQPLPIAELKHCIAKALTYHLQNRRN